MRTVTWPHLRAGEPVVRHDIGDSLARKHGVWVVPVVCGRENVTTTLTTKSAERTRCPDCLAGRCASCGLSVESEWQPHECPPGFS